MKSVLEMNESERKKYLRNKAIHKVKNKLNNKFRERMVNTYAK